MTGNAGHGNVTNAERLRIQVLHAAGVPYEVLAAAVGRNLVTIHRVLNTTGGLPPRRVGRSPLRLSIVEREEISRGLTTGESYRSIARRLGRAPSTVMREVRALKRGRRGYP